ncbi:hypothetical protein [Hydrogenimonas sp.]
MVRIVCILCLGLIFATGADMKESIKDLQTLRTEYEPKLLETEGVEGIGFGIREDGKKVLKIYISAPEEAVRAKLPAELEREDVELEFVGEVKAE